MDKFSGGIEMDENPPTSCGDPCSDDRKVYGLFSVHNVVS